MEGAEEDKELATVRVSFSNDWSLQEGGM